MKYDDASWHYGGEGFPKGLDDSAGGTHAGMFLAWAILAGLGSEDHADSEGFASLKGRAVSPGKYFMASCDGKLTDEDFSELGNLFTAYYFDDATGTFYDDYGDAVEDESRESLYEVPDTWATYDTLEPVFSRRFAAWKAMQPGELQAF